MRLYWLGREGKGGGEGKGREEGRGREGRRGGEGKGGGEGRAEVKCYVRACVSNTHTIKVH